MADFIDVMFLLSFLVIVGIIFAKFYNLLSKTEWYDIRMTWLLFGAFLFFYGVGMFSFLSDPENILFSVLFTLESLFVTLVFILTVVEQFMYLGKKATGDSRKAYNSLEESKGVI